LSRRVTAPLGRTTPLELSHAHPYDAIVGATHWNEVWERRAPDEVTWFQAHPAASLRFITQVSDLDAGIIDVGGGASRLVDHLLDLGYTDVTVLDIAAGGLAAAQRRLGDSAARVCWLVGDVGGVTFDRRFDVWHDRAVFHFLVEPVDRDRYIATLRRALSVGGHLVLATFGPDGPEQCSGLPVRRYGVDSMRDTIGHDFELLAHELEQHVAPTGITQQFLYALFRRTR
jgi:SAM-dependent methyltransferase